MRDDVIDGDALGRMVVDVGERAVDESGRRRDWFRGFTNRYAARRDHHVLWDESRSAHHQVEHTRGPVSLFLVRDADAREPWTHVFAGEFVVVVSEQHELVGNGDSQLVAEDGRGGRQIV